MAINRIRISKDKSELVKSLVDFNGGVGPYQTYADVKTFAATLGSTNPGILKSLTFIAFVLTKPGEHNLTIILYLFRSYLID